MCNHPERDTRGRLLPGSTANPGGRPKRPPYVRLLEAAQECGATIVVEVPPHLVPPRAEARRARRVDTDPTPP